MRQTQRAQCRLVHKTHNNSLQIAPAPSPQTHQHPAPVGQPSSFIQLTATHRGKLSIGRRGQREKGSPIAHKRNAFTETVPGIGARSVPSPTECSLPFEKVLSHGCARSNAALRRPPRQLSSGGRGD
ncbi:hypothetical protein Ddc_15700 [Ditylenchus destructor]|nr:hypothetical protein Ddc_15700 [Ditylenchus destructor]